MSIRLTNGLGISTAFPVIEPSEPIVTVTLPKFVVFIWMVPGPLAYDPLNCSETGPPPKTLPPRFRVARNVWLAVLTVTTMLADPLLPKVLLTQPPVQLPAKASAGGAQDANALVSWMGWNAVPWALV